MDALIAAAARALAAGDPLGALNRVALREDAAALALRGIAMAQLGDLERARLLLRRAARAFGPREPRARARCLVAEAEVALAARELTWPPQTLEAARRTLERLGDRENAAHARLLAARRLLLLGRLDAADERLAMLDPAMLPPPLRASHALAQAGIALRRVRAGEARAALARAEAAAALAGIPALTAEVAALAALLERPAGRLVARGTERPLGLAEVEALRRRPDLLVDAQRLLVRDSGGSVALARRPVLFALARALAEAWPGDVGRDTLVARAFGGKRADDSHRARLRVEVGRLRRLLRGLASIAATPEGFALKPARAQEVRVLAWPLEERQAPLLALLADGEAWSTSALALALGSGQRQVQRALEELARHGKAAAVGRGRARRWTLPPLPGFASVLLLPALPAGD